MSIIWILLGCIVMALLFSFLVWLDLYLGKKNVKDHVASEPIASTGEASLLTTGTEFYDTLFEEIEKARHHLHIQFYIVNDDCIGKELTALLKRKAYEGIEVRLLLDYLGSFLMKKKTIKELQLAGVKFAYSARPSFPFFFYKLNRRNHRKIAIIDGAVGFTGGFNVGDEYLGRNPKLGDWRDYHLCLQGPVISSLQKQFAMDWETATSETLTEAKYFPTLKDGSIHFTTMFAKQDIVSFLLQQMNEAQERIFIGSPYFIPGKAILQALLHARKRGVDVTLLVPMKADHPIVKEASYPYLQALLLAGCNVYQYYEGFFHAKVFIADNKIGDIGTTNFDERSLFLNEEVNCVFTSQELLHDTLKAIEDDLDRSERLYLEDLTQQSVWTKVKVKLGETFSSFL
ncbi:phospholipase D/transphosphatidylase [Fictibacillus macauensis ZFHKF-1]|uniref:Cardiolipin synthase n=1 Tax=Fictibacillus macauensis ZFHKF-1 TaxID=1196324 RepID=I8AN91_9BACL|nr:cardiolipin synthase [Fictibacillus macauensis]EIT87472.1 phospholipase D/transphosphatidylase [Fictibacillus macauensis ZFHKF-1]